MLPPVNYRPEGKPPAYAQPETMVVNQEVWELLSGHYAVPRWPDGACACGDDNIDGLIPHLIEVLQSKSGGNMPTFTEEPDVEVGDKPEEGPNYLGSTADTVSPLVDYVPPSIYADAEPDEVQTGEGGEGSSITETDWVTERSYFVAELGKKALDTAICLQGDGDVDSLLSDATKIYNWLIDGGGVGDY